MIYMFISKILYILSNKRSDYCASIIFSISCLI